MTNQRERSPNSCQFRHQHLREGQERWSCSLVARVVGPVCRTPCYVERETCDACCNQFIPSGPRLNSVVAAQVYSTTEKLQKNTDASAQQQAEINQAKVFATRWLSAVDHDGERVVDESSESCMEESHDSTERKSAVRIGLLGQHAGFGLAHQNRDLAIHLGVDRWFIPSQAERPPSGPCRIDEMSRPPSVLEVEAWLDGIDVVLFVERPVFAQVTRVARRLNVRVVCIPNWEWLHPGLDWLRDVDLMLCPTRHTAQILASWKRRFGYTWTIAEVPWPVDTDRFQFRLRRTCERFVYVNGSGGALAKPVDGSSAGLRRKGLDVLCNAARLVPEIPIIVYANRHDLPELPSNIEARPLLTDNRLLYSDGDVCVQPSYWEGLGLPLLECQAAGMPLITSDAPPMNEHQPLAMIPTRLEMVRLTSDIWIPAAIVEPEDLATEMRAIFRSRIGSHSRKSRRFVERDHSWNSVAPRILEHLRQCVIASPPHHDRPALQPRNDWHAS